jgi:hypothetical protein
MNFGIVADRTTDLSFISSRVFPNNDINELVSEAIRCTSSTLTTLKHFP